MLPRASRATQPKVPSNPYSAFAMPARTGNLDTSSAPCALDGLRVLVVEDDPDIRELLASILAQAGAVVASAESAEEGIDAVRRFRPELLLSDIGMPHEDGYSFMQRVRALG